MLLDIYIIVYCHVALGALLLRDAADVVRPSVRTAFSAAVPPPLGPPPAGLPKAADPGLSLAGDSPEVWGVEYGDGRCMAEAEATVEEEGVRCSGAPAVPL